MFFLTKQVYYSIVVACEESDKVSEQQHEGCVDNAIVEVRWCGLKLQESVQLVVERRKRFQELLSAHLAEGPTVLPARIIPILKPIID